MKKYQFNHKRRYKNGNLLPKGGTTSALENVSKAHFDMLFNGEAESIVLHFGLTNCLSTDHYNKTTGRGYALAKAQAYNFRIIGKYLGENYRGVRLDCKALNVAVVLRNYKHEDGKDFDRVYFEEIIK